MYKRGTVYWLRVRLEDGRVLRRSLGTGDRMEAVKRERELLAKIKAGLTGAELEVKEYTIAQAVADVLAQYYSGKKYEHVVRYALGQVVAHFGGTRPLRVISGRAINEWLVILRDEEKDSPATINRKLSALRRMLAHAVTNERLDTLPAFPPKLKEPEGRVRVVSHDEEAKLIEFFVQHRQMAMAALVVVLVDTGARLSEALNLRPERVNYDSGVVTFRHTKTGTPRSVPLTKRAALELRRWVEQGGAFAGITGDTVSRQWARAREALGLAKDREFVPHSLRHTCASRMLAAGVDLYTIKEWLGHSTITMTERYSHLHPVKLEGARDALERRPEAGNVVPLVRRAQS